MNTEHEFIDTNRHLVEVPDSFAIARWPRNADVATIARCILGTLKYEPHTADTTLLRCALERVIAETQPGGSRLLLVPGIVLIALLVDVAAVLGWARRRWQ